MLGHHSTTSRCHHVSTSSSSSSSSICSGTRRGLLLHQQRSQAAAAAAAASGAHAAALPQLLQQRQCCGRAAVAVWTPARVLVQATASSKPASSSSSSSSNGKSKKQLRKQQQQQQHQDHASSNKRLRHDSSNSTGSSLSSSRPHPQNKHKQQQGDARSPHPDAAAAGADSSEPGQAAPQHSAARSRSGKPPASGRGKQSGGSKGSDSRGDGSAVPGRAQQQQQGRNRRAAGNSSKPRELLGQLCGKAESLQELQQLLQDHASSINYVALAAAYTRAAKLCQRQPCLAQSAEAQQLLQHLDQLLPSVQQQLDARGLSNIIWSCAYTQHTAPVAVLLPDFVQPSTMSAANSHDIGNVLWALATLEQRHVPKQQLQRLLAALADKADAADPQHISNCLWALATLEQRQVPQQPLQRLLAALADKAGAAKPQDISNSLWAVGKLGQQVPPQQLQQLLAAFTAAGVLAQATPQAVVNVLLGMAYMGQQVNDEQLQQLVEALVRQLSRANAQDVSMTLWAVSEMGQQLPPQQLELLLAAFARQLHRATPQAVSNTLLACARFRHAPVQLLSALEQQEQQHEFLAAANTQDLANTSWACGMLGHSSKRLLAGLLQQAVALLQQDNSRFVCQELCNLCWAVAVLDMQQLVPAVLQLAGAAASRDVWGSAAPQDLQQLYQVHLWLLDNQLAPAAAGKGGKGAGLLQVLSQQQLGECRQAWQQQVAASAAAAPSPFQQEVFDALQQLAGWQAPPQQEVVTADGNFSIDIAAVTTAGARLVVEVDGPTHYVSPGNRLNGPTQSRNRALAARGYTVVSIPGWEWRQLKGAGERADYLQRKLQGLPASGTLPAAAAAAPAVPAAVSLQPAAASAPGTLWGPQRIRRRARPSSGRL